MQARTYIEKKSMCIVELMFVLDLPSEAIVCGGLLVVENKYIVHVIFCLAVNVK